MPSAAKKKADKPKAPAAKAPAAKKTLPFSPKSLANDIIDHVPDVDFPLVLDHVPDITAEDVKPGETQLQAIIRIARERRGPIPAPAEPPPPTLDDLRRFYLRAVEMSEEAVRLFSSDDEHGQISDQDMIDADDFAEKIRAALVSRILGAHPGENGRGYHPSVDQWRRHHEPYLTHREGGKVYILTAKDGAFYPAPEDFVGFALEPIVAKFTNVCIIDAA